MEATQNEALTALMDKLSPLLASGRLDNVVDLLSLLSDLTDIADNALVEKLAGLFEDLTALGWEGGMALKMAHSELQRDAPTASLRALYGVLRQPDTLLGLMLVLRTLQIIGQRMRSSRLPAESPEE
ncbi:TPA: hypothetical protein ACOQZT_003819 [Serratia odorifera]|jgi:uncharacterized protein YjgD (DUF1641 family)|uniref:hypothetical protein n=1 Tax=Serratia odorifera TaxID=618 RepID=UPI0018E8A270|nr:hypothetical protein [Serratia odorifera]MBJ2065445.1 hypothetical protein [Serratia odorifera]HEJ9096797.1 hypothetical protein [Serratia odorifera]